MSSFSNKHIMHIIESLEFGGAEKVVVHLANLMSKHCRVSICLTKRQGELIKQLDKDITVHFLDTGEGNNFELPRKLTKLITDEKVDVLHSHDWGVYLESALSIKRTVGTKLIHTVHGHYTNYNPGWKSALKKLARHFLERRASKYTYQLIPVSDSIREYIIKDIGISDNKVSRIHNGIAGLAKINTAKKELNSEPKILKLIAVGRIAKIKNFPLLLNGLALALKKNSNIALEIVGDGPELNHLKELTGELDIKEKVSFMGFRTDISERLNLNDVFVLSSDYEGISIAILEAMSLSMPVIATNVGGVSDTVIDHKTGLLVEKGNPIEYCEAILKFADAPEQIKTFGNNAKNHFDNEFHESVVLEQYMSLYQGALDS